MLYLIFRRPAENNEDQKDAPNDPVLPCSPSKRSRIAANGFDIPLCVSEEKYLLQYFSSITIFSAQQP